MRSSRLSSVSRVTILLLMEAAPSYSKPPVREALIDIRISPLPPTQLPALEALHDQLRSSYPTKKKQQNLQGLWEWREETLSSRTSQRIAGFQFESSDGTRIVQYRLDGFTCNFIKPDPQAAWAGWAALREEARRSWEIYSNTVGINETIGLGVRYINQIVIPTAPIELTDYLVAPPSIPPNIPYQTFIDWLSRVTVTIPDLNASAIITQAPAAEPRPDSLTILFDIDITRMAKAPLDPEAMWTTLDQFRTLKNTIFEASLRDKAKELFR